MTQDQIKWLADPVAELEKQPPGTLIMIQNTTGVLHLARLMEEKSAAGAIRYQHLPDFGVKTVQGALTRHSRLALV